MKRDKMTSRRNVISTSLTDEELNEFEDIRKSLGLSKSEMLRSFVMTGIYKNISKKEC
jgi:hypothetical protein